MKIKKNLAAILTGQKKSLSIYNIEVPQIPDGYVLVKMKYSGICHTQLNEIDGILGKDNFLPHCIGHEGVGEIFKKGKIIYSVIGSYSSANRMVGVPLWKNQEPIEGTDLIPGVQINYGFITPLY